MDRPIYKCANRGINCLFPVVLPPGGESARLNFDGEEREIAPRNLENDLFTVAGRSGTADPGGADRLR